LIVAVCFSLVPSDSLAASIACIIPSPARDLKTGEEIARGTARGRRGSWADLFSASWWARGSDWGQREMAAGPGVARGPALGAPGTTYEERTGYREREPLPPRRDEPGYREREYAYRESPRELERGREREREREREHLAASERERHLAAREHESDPRAKGWMERTGEAMGLTTGPKHEVGTSGVHHDPTAPMTTERQTAVV
jgi:hypothetical protein